MPRIAIIDYGIGNKRSVHSALEKVGASPEYVSTGRAIEAASGLIVPGVGAFPDCISALRASGMLAALLDAVSAGKPTLGICVGMQMLFEGSEEFGYTPGLGLIPGTVRRLQVPATARTPHIAWNSIARPSSGEMLKGIDAGARFYFVHSFAPYGVPSEFIAGHSTYGSHDFVSAVERSNLWGTQFHPEKSAGSGLHLLGNFTRVCHRYIGKEKDHAQQ